MDMGYEKMQKPDQPLGDALPSIKFGYATPFAARMSSCASERNVNHAGATPVLMKHARVKWDDARDAGFPHVFLGTPKSSKLLVIVNDVNVESIFLGVLNLRDTYMGGEKEL